MKNEFTLRSGRRNELIDITARLRAIVTESGVSEGLCHVFVPHTTAAVTINEKADPAVASDIAAALERIVPPGWNYRHAEGNSDAHVKATLVGPGVSLLIAGGELVLGAWQSVFLCEFDGPRSRRCIVRISG